MIPTTQRIHKQPDATTMQDGETTMPSAAQLKNAIKARAEKTRRQNARRAQGLTPNEPRVKRVAKGFVDLPKGWELPLADFLDRSGIGPTALRRARRNGLIVTPVGTLRYVRQADWQDYLTQCSAEVKRSQSPEPTTEPVELT